MGRLVTAERPWIERATLIDNASLMFYLLRCHATTYSGALPISCYPVWTGHYYSTALNGCARRCRCVRALRACNLLYTCCRHAPHY